MNPELYNRLSYYYRRGIPEEFAYNEEMLRYGDQLAAIAYAYGIPSFEAYKDLFRFDGEGQTPKPKMSTINQMFPIRRASTRTPKGILTIGEGRGEVALVLAHHGVPVYALEPSKHFTKMYHLTLEKFGMPQSKNKIPNFTPLNFCLKDLDLLPPTVDTIMFIESVEHIEAEEFDAFWAKGWPGRYIFVNWLSAHPLPLIEDDHVRVIDDAFYDKISEGATVVYRNKSHLVLER